MRLLNRFLDWVHDGFSRSPAAVEVIVIRAPDSSLRLTLEDNTLVCRQADAVVLSVVVDGLTVADVYGQLAALYPDSVLQGGLDDKSARILLPPRRFMDSSSGQFVFVIGAYQSLLYVLLDTYATQLEAVRDDLAAMLAQAYLATAAGEWLEVWGGYFGVARLLDEADDDYVRRIVAGLIKPKCNNVSMEVAIGALFRQAVSVEDIAERPSWFRVRSAFDLLGNASPTEFAAAMAAFIGSTKAAGTQLDSLSLVTPTIGDSLAVAQKARDRLPLTISQTHFFDGRYGFNGVIQFQATMTGEVL